MNYSLHAHDSEANENFAWGTMDKTTRFLCRIGFALLKLNFNEKATEALGTLLGCDLNSMIFAYL